MPSGSRQQGGSLSEQVAGVLRAEVARQQIGQAALAEKVGVSQSQLSKYLAGRKVLNVTELDSVCDALGLSVLEVIAEAERRAVGNRTASTVKGLRDDEAAELQAAIDTRGQRAAQPPRTRRARA